MLNDKQILAALRPPQREVSPGHLAEVKRMLKMIGISVMARRPVQSVDFLTSKETVEVVLNGSRCPNINPQAMVRLAQALKSLDWELSFEADANRRLKLIFITDSDATESVSV